MSLIIRSFFTRRQPQSSTNQKRRPVPLHKGFSASAGFQVSRATQVTKPRGEVSVHAGGCDSKEGADCGHSVTYL